VTVVKLSLDEEWRPPLSHLSQPLLDPREVLNLLHILAWVKQELNSCARK